MSQIWLVNEIDPDTALVNISTKSGKNPMKTARVWTQQRRLPSSHLPCAFTMKTWTRYISHVARTAEVYCCSPISAPCHRDCMTLQAWAENSLLGRL